MAGYREDGCSEPVLGEHGRGVRDDALAAVVERDRHGPLRQRAVAKSHAELAHRQAPGAGRGDRSGVLAEQRRLDA